MMYARRRAGRRAGVLLGVGLGAFVDGILLHQIVHWHNMLSARLPPTSMDALATNMRADGVFHAGAWLVVLLGVYLFRADAETASHGGAPMPSSRMLTGQLLAGWGAFNLVEGAVDHHLLQLHHVRDLPRHVPLWDWLFLGLGGALFLVMGLVMAKARPRW